MYPVDDPAPISRVGGYSPQLDSGPVHQPASHGPRLSEAAFRLAYGEVHLASGQHRGACHTRHRALGFAVQPHADGVKAAWVNESYTADDPVALLGLIRMVELRTWDWLPTDEEVDQTLRRIGWV
jgi:hypothetical protein